MTWRNRIAGEGLAPAGELLNHPANFRRHGDAQRAAMDGALSELGWIQRVVVNRRAGRIIDGHLRADMARAAGDKVPVLYVDLSEDEERVALATLDPELRDRVMPLAQPYPKRSKQAMTGDHPEQRRCDIDPSAPTPIPRASRARKRRRVTPSPRPKVA